MLTVVWMILQNLFFFLFKFDDAVVVMLKNKNKVFKKSFLNERYNYSGACGAHGRSE